VNACRDRTRARQRTAPTRSLPPALAAAQRGPAADLERRELRQRVASAVEALPAEEREAIVLRHFHDLNAGEIADVVGRPRTTVQSCLARALARLNFRLKSHAGAPAFSDPVTRTP
jgi:RNA polymerase sigma-70 factor (ECF subfamily)